MRTFLQEITILSNDSDLSIKELLSDINILLNNEKLFKNQLDTVKAMNLARLKRIYEECEHRDIIKKLNVPMLT